MNGSVPRKHHYIPVTYMSAFTADANPRVRRRRAFIFRRKSSRIVLEAIENIGAINDYYRTKVPMRQDGGDPYHLERNWAKLEAKLRPALDALADVGSLSIRSETWARTLVPFVTSLLVRGPSFDKDFTSRSPVFDPANGLVSPDNVNNSRLLEMHYLLADVMASRWIVLHCSSPEPIITNDLGYTYTTYLDQSGYAIPLNPATVLVVVPNRSRTIARGRWPESWTTPIEHRMLPIGDQLGLNNAISRAAQQFIIGSTESALAAVADEMTLLEPGSLPNLYFATLSARARRAHEYDWHRFVCALTLTPGDARISSFEMPVEALASAWSPAVHWIAIGNPSPRTIGLRYTPPDIWIDLDEPDEFGDHVSRLFKSLLVRNRRIGDLYPLW